MINSNNIAAYIEYLYRKKNNADAPLQLIEKWKQLPENEIHIQLDNLYETWNYNFVRRGALVQEFMQKQNVGIINDMTPQVPINAGNTNNNSNKNIKKKNIWLRPILSILIIGLIAGGLYLVYKYMHFKNLHQIYTLTERVAIRTENGEQIGTLDLNATGNTNSYQQLTAYDKEIYNRAIDSTGKLYEHRKVLMQTNNFWAFVQNKPEIFAYVNAKFVVDSKEEYEMYKRIFGQLNAADNKRLQLQHRQIIANCLKRSSALKNLYAISACNAKTNLKSAAGIITHELIADNKYEILLRLSDGYYYLCTGDVVSNSYEIPKRIGYVQDPNRDDEYLTGNMLFKFNAKNKQFYLANCSGVTLPYHSVNDATGALLFFEKDAPTESPMQPLEEFTEQAEDVIENVKDAVENLLE